MGSNPTPSTSHSRNFSCRLGAPRQANPQTSGRHHAAFGLNECRWQQEIRSCSFQTQMANVGLKSVHDDAGLLVVADLAASGETVGPRVECRSAPDLTNAVGCNLVDRHGVSPRIAGIEAQVKSRPGLNRRSQCGRRFDCHIGSEGWCTATLWFGSNSV